MHHSLGMRQSETLWKRMRQTLHRYHLDQAIRFQALPAQLLVLPVPKISIKLTEQYGET